MPKKRKTENELKLSDDVLDCLHADIEKINTIAYYDEKIKAQLLLKNKIQSLINIKTQLMTKMQKIENVQNNMPPENLKKMSIDELDNYASSILNSNDDIEKKVSMYETLLLQIAACKKELNTTNNVIVFQTAEL